MFNYCSKFSRRNHSMELNFLFLKNCSHLHRPASVYFLATFALKKLVKSFADVSHSVRINQGIDRRIEMNEHRWQFQDMEVVIAALCYRYDAQTRDSRCPQNDESPDYHRQCNRALDFPAESRRFRCVWQKLLTHLRLRTKNRIWLWTLNCFNFFFSSHLLQNRPINAKVQNYYDESRNDRDGDMNYQQIAQFRYHSEITSAVEVFTASPEWREKANKYAANPAWKYRNLRYRCATHVVSYGKAHSPASVNGNCNEWKHWHRKNSQQRRVDHQANVEIMRRTAEALKLHFIKKCSRSVSNPTHRRDTNGNSEQTDQQVGDSHW